MITVNSISGGMTSGYIGMNYPADYNVFSLVCINDSTCKPKDKALIAYVNDKLSSFSNQFGEFIATAEDDATLIALMELEQLMGKNIIWVRGASFDDVIDYPLHDGSNPGILPTKLRRYCTTEMKMYSIFKWWFSAIGVKVNMRIGFRFDEYDRMEKFLNGENANLFKIPVSCSTRGQRLQKHEAFNWRTCSFPLIKNAITKPMIQEFWRSKSIKWPVVSNCIGCFHKRPETLAIMAAMHPEKFQWFADQETKGMGTFLSSKIPYQSIINNSKSWTPEMISESGGACDSGGCTD